MLATNLLDCLKRKTYMHKLTSSYTILNCVKSTTENIKLKQKRITANKAIEIDITCLYYFEFISKLK